MKKTYNYKIVGTNKASGYGFEAKFEDVVEWFDAAEMYKKISSNLYLFKKVSGKWSRCCSVDCAV